MTIRWFWVLEIGNYKLGQTGLFENRLLKFYYIYTGLQGEKTKHRTEVLFVNNDLSLFLAKSYDIIIT